MPGKSERGVAHKLRAQSNSKRGESELVIIISVHLVTPVDNESDLALPTDRIRIPNESSLFLLGQTLRNRGINAVYASERTRTLATGLALSAADDNIEIFGDDASLQPTPEWVEELRRKHAEDRAILIVGHSNTVDDLVIAFRPDIAECLERFNLARPAIPEEQYGDIWRLSLRPGLADCRGINRQVLTRTEQLDCTTP